MSDEGMRVGAAGNQAATVLQGAWRAIADGQLDAGTIGKIYGDLVAEFAEAMNTVQASISLAQNFGATPASPQETQQFQQAAQQFQPPPQAPQFQPGPNPFPPANQQAPQQQAPQQQGQNFQPQQAPGSGHRDDADWAKLFQNPGGFWDNRQSKKTPASPDFREKDGNTALWLNGKFGPAPQWVFDRLQGGYGPVQ